MDISASGMVLHSESLVVKMLFPEISVAFIKPQFPLSNVFLRLHSIRVSLHVTPNWNGKDLISLTLNSLNWNSSILCAAKRSITGIHTAHN